MKSFINHSRVRAFRKRVKESFINVIDNPIGRPAKKAVITVVGVFITLLGVILIILPGPASLLIPIGLGVLALEYPIARKWLRKFQRVLSASAKKADQLVARYFNLKKSVESRKSAQPLVAPGKLVKALPTNQVGTAFSSSPCTPMAYTSFSRSTDFSRFKKGARP